MKKIYITFLIFNIFTSVFGQVSNYGIDDFSAIQQGFYTNYSDTIQDTNYLKTIKQFKRWEQFWGPRLTGYNSFDSIAKKSFDNQNMQRQMSSTMQEDHSKWVELGPNTNGLYGVGRIDAIKIDPSNSNIIYAGAPSGGLWKTIDGGANWFNISDNYFTSLGVSSIAIDPANNNIIYAATGDVNTETTYSHGVYRSNDGGVTWVEINTGLIDENTPHFTIGKIVLHPTNNSVAFLATSLGIYKCININDNNPVWTKVYPSSGSEYMRNIGFNPDNSNILYAVGIDIVTSNDNGASWSRLATAANGLDFSGTPWPNALNGLYIQMMNMDIDPSGSYLYVNGVVRNSAPPWNWQSYKSYRLWKYDIENDIWTEGTNHPPITPGRTEMAVSPTNSETLFTGGVSLWKSTNGGDNWNYIGYGSRHSDYHEILFAPNDNNTLFVGTDGGIYKIDLQNQTSTELNNGLGISTMYNMASSVIDPYQILAGSQDCGNNYFKNSQWSHKLTSDGFQSYMDEEDINIMYTTNYISGNGALWRSTNNANNPSNWSRISSTQESSWFGASLVAHPDKTYELYQARQNIWKIPNARTDSSDDWIKISAFQNKFPNISYGVNYALEIAPSNGDYIYTTYVDGTSWVTNFNKVKLVKTTTGGGLNSNDWSDITPDPYDGEFTYFISDIAVSDINSNEIWVCYSGYMDGLKVMHYNGSTWNNYSEGLPNVPVNVIVYYKGSNDMLFVGTDIGVYYRDNSMDEWKPFTKDLPNVIVNWLEVNYTNKTLRAATYGRGLWETDLICTLPGDKLTINEQNAVWDSPMQINNTVTILNGSKLTITSDIEFSPFGQIIVEPGAKLILNGATLTNACSEPWQGIQVWGDKTHSQYPDANGNYYQGYLELENGAVIENAVCAIDLWKPEDWSTTGGIVYADGAVFRNNVKAVHALFYKNSNPNNPQEEWDYSSNFKNCTFEITQDYLGTETFYKHVDLSHIRGIDFQHCTFSLADNVNGVATYNTGIAGYDAQFRVSALCSSQVAPCPEADLQKCTFTGFYRAISALNDGESPVTFSVYNAEFINNAYGIKTRSVQNATVLYSNFEIGELYNCGAGINSDNVTGFAFEENDFSKFTGGPLGHYYGIIINNSHDINEVYKNSFTGLSYANFADGKNWIGDDRYHGLAYYCNQNSNNYADFFVNDDRPSGIQTFQGSNSNPAGNTFTQNGATWHFYNGGEHLVQYFYNQNVAAEIPDPDKVNENVALTPIDAVNGCPSHYNNDVKTVLTAAQKADAEQAYYNNLSDYNNVKTLYDSYIDGGSTSDEKLDIETAQPDDMWALRSQLLGDSPHLSFDVLKKAADKTDVFTESALFDILAANPDELRKDTLISYLENKEQPLPDYMIDLLKQLAKGTTYKTALQEQMSDYKHNYTRAALDIIRSILNDTVANDTLLRNWLDNLGGINYDRQIIASYVNEGNFSDAFSLANMLPQLYDLDSTELIEHNYYIDLLTLYDTLYSQGRNTYQMDSTEKALVEYIASNSTDVAGSYAESILEAVDDVHYPDCPDITETASYKHGAVINSETLGKVFGLVITVKPNPARQWAAFDYSLPENEESGTLTITNVNGVVVKTIQVTGHQGQKLVDTRRLPAGMYLYTIKSGSYTKSGKLMVTK